MQILLELHGNKLENWSWSNLDPAYFEIDLDAKISIFSHIYLLLHILADVCVQVLFLFSSE